MIAAGTATVRVGLLGAGRIGRLHGELLARRVPDAEVAAVFDTDGPLAEELAQQLGAAAAASVEELLAADLDAVAICSSSDTHVELILAATEAGKAIFCEKPVSLELGEVDRALAAVRRAGVPFQIGFNRRFDPGHESVRRAVV
jgi:myo-inositol 2-dehydrogenase/D-chiro-inositol 1-dehydrogenase